MPAVISAADPELLSVVVIGAVGAHKGSRVLLSLALDAQIRKLPIRFHLVGYSDVTEALKGAGVEETGRYRNDGEAAALVAAAKPTCILLPSIWPETFCYTLSLAFRLRVPPVVFDLGAQAERVKRAGFGFVLPPAAFDDPSGLNDRLLALPYADARHAEPPRASLYPTMIGDYYGLGAPSQDAEPKPNGGVTRDRMLDVLDRGR